MNQHPNIRLVKGNQTQVAGPETPEVIKPEINSDYTEVDALIREFREQPRRHSDPTETNHVSERKSVDMRAMLRHLCDSCAHKWAQPVAAVRCPMCHSMAVVVTDYGRENAPRV